MTFLDAYITAALWSSTDYDGVPLDETPHELHQDTLAKMKADCLAFQVRNADDLKGIPYDLAGHDFWLTRNGHGAGFWDKGYGEVGDRLTKACKAFPEVDLYVGDDGFIHC